MSAPSPGGTRGRRHPDSSRAVSRSSAASGAAPRPRPRSPPASPSAPARPRARSRQRSPAAAGTGAAGTRTCHRSNPHLPRQESATDTQRRLAASARRSVRPRAAALPQGRCSAECAHSQPPHLRPSGAAAPAAAPGRWPGSGSPAAPAPPRSCCGASGGPAAAAAQSPAQAAAWALGWDRACGRTAVRLPSTLHGARDLSPCTAGADRAAAAGSSQQADYGIEINIRS